MIAHAFHRNQARQAGAALTVVMILLLVMTLLGLASTRSSLLQERMSGAMYDRALAFQAAEAALREGEDVAAGRPAAGTGCTSGLCGFPDPAAAPVWTVESNWTSAPTVDVEGLASDAQFLVEVLAVEVPVNPEDCTTFIDVSAAECTGNGARYRITARSRDTGRASVMVQSIYAVP